MVSNGQRQDSYEKAPTFFVELQEEILLENDFIDT